MSILAGSVLTPHHHGSIGRTLFYRRLRKKGTQEDQLKKAKKRVIISTAATRGIQGLSIAELNAKANESADKRKAVKEASLR